MASTATGVLLAWKRLDNLPPIIKNMLDAGMQEVIVWSNRSMPTTRCLRESIENRFPHCNVLVIGEGVNLYTLGRYKAAWIANSPLIATCDDDCLVKNWKELLRRGDEDHRLVANVQPGHYECYVRHGGWVHPFNGGTAYEALVGWGAVFPRDMVRRLDVCLHKFPNDELFQRKADRFFTMLQAMPHTLINHYVRDLPGATDEMALYRMADHWDLNRAAQVRAIAILEAEAACTES